MQQTEGYGRLHQTFSNTKANAMQSETKWSLLWRGLNVVMCLFFVLCAVVQLNDPDPYIWIPVYGVPALFSLVTAVKPDVTDNSAWRLLCVLCIAIYAVGSLYLLALLIEVLAGRVKNPLHHEEGRELAGVIIVILWLCVCRFSSFGSTQPGVGRVNGLLVCTTAVSLLPLLFWSMCFISGLSHLAHCTEMFPGILGA